MSSSPTGRTASERSSWSMRTARLPRLRTELEESIGPTSSYPLSSPDYLP
jgi:hypothetical protein